jgi:O-methyltransferase involved in polyketide biosynthesis
MTDRCLNQANPPHEQEGTPVMATITPDPADKVKARLGAVQETLFITLAARARETRKRRPVLRDPKAAEIVASVDFDTAKYGRGWGSAATVLRTAILDSWVSAFLAEHPAGTVVEIGTGLNTRFDRVDNGQVHWIDLDLPDTIELRRRFFADSERRRMIAASVLDEDWLPVVQASPGPYIFVAEGVLVYLAQATEAITRIAERFPGALIAFDTYRRRMLEQQHRMAARKQMDARWVWACDDPRSLESPGLEVVETTAITRPPGALGARLPRRYRYLLPLASRIAGDVADVTLFRQDSHRRCRASGESGGGTGPDCGQAAYFSTRSLTCGSAA